MNTTTLAPFYEPEEPAYAFAEQLGRSTVTDAGRLSQLRERFALSRNRFAHLMGMSGEVIKRWEEEPARATTMHSMSAIRLGIFLHYLEAVEAWLIENDLDRWDLTSMATLSGELGLGTNSRLITEKCQTGALHCVSLGKLGIYIPNDQAEALRAGTL